MGLSTSTRIKTIVLIITKRTGSLLPMARRGVANTEAFGSEPDPTPETGVLLTAASRQWTSL